MCRPSVDDTNTQALHTANTPLHLCLLLSLLLLSPPLQCFGFCSSVCVYTTNWLQVTKRSKAKVQARRSSVKTFIKVRGCVGCCGGCGVGRVGGRAGVQVWVGCMVRWLVESTSVVPVCVLRGEGRRAGTNGFGRCLAVGPDKLGAAHKLVPSSRNYTQLTHMCVCM